MEAVILALRVLAGLNTLDAGGHIEPENRSQSAVVEETSRPACDNLNAYLRANLAPGHPCATTAAPGSR
jgi:hypothetical protein